MSYENEGFIHQPIFETSQKHHPLIEVLLESSTRPPPDLWLDPGAGLEYRTLYPNDRTNEPA